VTIVKGRIYFPGNPWPEGHALEQLLWGARLDSERGLLFDLHLTSAAYYAERNAVVVDDAAGDFQSAGVWSNYHACTLSSSYWHEGGWVVGDDDAPLVFAELAERTFVVDDPASPGFALDDLEDRAFHIYLLGHDDVVDHRIRFAPDATTGLWTLDWRGRIALAYVGDDDHRHSFRVEATGLGFAGFRLGPDMSESEARSLVQRWCRDPGDLELVTEGRVRALRARPAGPPRTG
jgi:hypothetical protein